MPKTIDDVVRQLHCYSPDAFEFLHEGLDYTVQHHHGEAVKAIRQIYEWLEEQGAELTDLPDIVSEGRTPRDMLDLIEELGGPDSAASRMNLHVNGEQLCWGLRDLALEKWGLMAPVVLGGWGIRSTADFGRMVFALVENGLLQKQPDDAVEDFVGVFDFRTAFDDAYKIDLTKTALAAN